MDDGLSFRDVRSIVQDENGMIWIGTRNGLNKFDGYDFTNFNVSANSEKGGLIGNYIHDLKIDSEGNLIIATETGLSILNVQTEVFSSFTPNQLFAERTDLVSVDKVVVTKHSGRVFLQSPSIKSPEYFYSTFEFKDGESTVFKLKLKDTTYALIRDVFEDASHNLWVRPANHPTFYCLNQQDEVIKEVSLPDTIFGLSFDMCRFDYNVVPSEEYYWGRAHIFELDPNENQIQLIASFCDGKSARLCSWNLETGKLFRIRGDDDQKWNMTHYQFVDNEGNIWLQQNDKTLLISKKGTFEVTNETLKSNSHIINEFYQSNDGTIWLSTTFGIHRILKERHPFRRALNIPPNENGYGTSLRAMAEISRGQIVYAEVDNGLWSYDFEREIKKQILKDKEVGEAKIHHILPFAIHHRDSILWIANWYDDGVLRYDLRERNLVHIHAKDNLDGFARCMEAKSEDQLWVGTDRGLNKLDLNSGVLSLHLPKNDSAALKDLHIIELEKAMDGGLWIGSNNKGLFKLNPDNRFELIADNASSLSSNGVLSIHEDGKHVWVGTNSGLNRIKKSDKRITTFTILNGLADNTIYAIHPRQNKLWLSTNKGLCEFDPISESVRNYGIEEGLVHEEFNQRSSLKMSNGTLLFGGMNGLLSVDPEKEIEIQDEFEVVLTSFEKFEDGTGELKEFKINPEMGVDIYPGDKFFTFSFVLLDLFSSENIRYKYILDGFDEDWNLIGKDHSVRFNQLPPGEFVFKVKAMGRNGFWTEDSLEIPIRVHQAFYKSWWFIALMALVFVLIVYSIYKFRLAQIRKVEKLRVKIASDLHDDVGSLLTQISIQSELVNQGVYQEEELDSEMKKIAASSRSAIATMSDAVWSIDARQDKMVDLLDRMKEYGLDFLSRADIEFIFDQKGISHSDKKLTQEFRQNVYLIFKEAINNTVKYSDATKSEVTVKVNGGKFSMTIKDNGTSSSKGGKLPGQGLKNMKMRAENINGVLTIDKSNGYCIRLEKVKL